MSYLVLFIFVSCAFLTLFNLWFFFAKPISLPATLVQNAMSFRFASLILLIFFFSSVSTKKLVFREINIGEFDNKNLKSKKKLSQKSHNKSLIEVLIPCLLISFFSLVLKILVAAMENVDGEAGAAGPSTAGAESGADTSDFYNTGRVGRRNALPDILSSHATVSTADLPDQLSALTTSDKAGATGPVASTSSSSEPTPSTSQIATTSNS